LLKIGTGLSQKWELLFQHMYFIICVHVVFFFCVSMHSFYEYTEWRHWSHAAPELWIKTSDQLYCMTEQMSRHDTIRPTMNNFYSHKLCILTQKKNTTCTQIIKYMCWNKSSHFWDRPVPIFSDVRFSYLALVQDKKIMCVLPANACCTVYVNCPPNSPCYSFLK
jgi:hypothetical protein